MTLLEHGGNLRSAVAKYGGDYDQWLDLSTGISPFTPDMPDLSAEVFRKLPDPMLLTAVQKRAQAFYHSNAECRIIPGSQFAIELLPQLLNGPVGIVEPTYGEYAHAFDKNGCTYQSLDSLSDLYEVSSVVLANPNNPDGRKYDRDELIFVADRLRERDGLLVVDEAFAGLEEDDSLLPTSDRCPNLVVLRSVGKFFGLAGLRVGFVFAHDNILANIDQHIGPWMVSSPALHITDSVLSRSGLKKS